MKIAIAGEMVSFSLKEIVKQHLLEKGYEVVDLGMVTSEQPYAFYEIVPNVAKAIQNKEIDRGILFCGTGMGVSLCANKFKGVYAAAVESATTAELCYVINRANVLCMGKWIVGEKIACDMVDRWLNAEIGQGFSEERKKIQANGFQKLLDIENQNLK
ncbi:RpiB/LacA/LacB family sugar-phosphate isomerase [Petroclostridium sp. X23]|jgi:ribose 5-phosphate isomerase B|uniref:RpiB/LacA/LacB family sugar-phosphate isomerase n=1 Tax=Petroclostridium sp. X23 TaxID=3045146 RepID=UPI0024ADD1BE|nr:RpiB/LacA/LacB family sugar-phosphate isomerase [Petroclostridium sp. X23]WHH59007.1 RpiB/LacA/LacB family sugar-phosphate isomerase [Petroclostridium sp. X23]